ncbi:MAG: HAD family hydrolase [Alistipes sp.]|nr:HAD family hydrolase [Alistipes sp.]
MKPRLIIFDFDGTLCDTRQNIIKAFRATMDALGLPLRSEAACGATIGLTLRDGFAELYPALSDAEVEHAVATYRRIFAEHREEYMPALFAGVSDVLDKLHSDGYTLAIATSRLTDSLMLFMREHNIDCYFTYVVGSDSVEHHKPAPDPANKILATLGFKPSEAIVVGDMPVDVLMAHNADIKAVGVTYGNATRAELIAADADYIIDDIRELLPIVGTFC